ncbi:hypothetical protein ACG2F4_09625 [Halalkalibaculum sp. DA3122]
MNSGLHPVEPFLSTGITGLIGQGIWGGVQRQIVYLNWNASFIL